MNENTCAYPLCKDPIGLGLPKARQAFCEPHAHTLCDFAKVNLCKIFTTPNSSFCKFHDTEVQRFDYMHAIFHKIWAATEKSKQQALSVPLNLSHNGGGKL